MFVLFFCCFLIADMNDLLFLVSWFAGLFCFVVFLCCWFSFVVDFVFNGCVVFSFVSFFPFCVCGLVVFICSFSLLCAVCWFLFACLSVVVGV